MSGKSSSAEELRKLRQEVAAEEQKAAALHASITNGGRFVPPPPPFDATVTTLSKLSSSLGATKQLEYIPRRPRIVTHPAGATGSIIPDEAHQRRTNPGYVRGGGGRFYTQ
eukprot:tig00000194_g14769.t1